MTLILGAVAQGVVHQVADRRVVVEQGRTWQEHDTRSNKQIIVVGPDALVAIGYTGLAYLDGRPTDDVLAEAVAGRPLGRGMTCLDQVDAIHAVADRIAECVDGFIGPKSPFGLEVGLTGIKRGKRGRVEPLLWEVKKRPGTSLVVDRGEQTPFDWRRSFALQCLGDADSALVRRAVQTIKELQVEGLNRRDAVTEVLVDTLVRTAEGRPSTVGGDCMVVRLWRERGSPVVDAEYRPRKLHLVTARVPGSEFSFPAAYAPWFISQTFVASPAVVRGDGGWTIGDVRFRIRAPNSRDFGGPSVFFGSQEREPPPT